MSNRLYDLIEKENLQLDTQKLRDLANKNDLYEKIDTVRDIFIEENYLHDNFRGVTLICAFAREIKKALS